MPVLLRVNRLSHFYEEKTTDLTLRQVSFSVETGHIQAVVGESGSGKTTLLRLIAGRLDATDGEIRLSGKKVTGPSYNLVPGHPDIRTVFQDFALSPHLTVYHNIAHVLQAYRRDYREERTRELIRRFRLSGLEKQHPATLSGGEKQRVALARALAEEPALLLMDEPFSQVDPPLKRDLMREVVDILHETSGTALFVTHDAQDALSMADQVLMLRRGSVVQQGAPPLVYKRPLTPYAAQLMGPCSVVEARWVNKEHAEFDAGGARYLGIRPEHVCLSSDNEGIAGTVERSRYHGAYYEVVINAGETIQLLAHSHRPYTVGAPITFSLRLEKIIRFEP